MDEWLTDERWRELWLDKVEAYLARYAGDPVVMAWELWNEMDCVEGSWDLVREWTRHMLARIKQAAPQHLVVQSLGSFDDVKKQKVQDDLRDMPEMDFQQVHRYLDQGAPWAICHDDVTAFSVQAVQAARREDKPILLAETGAVNDRHTGLFRYSRMDNRGIIFHDVTFPAFFAGSAATGQCWFWDSYVDVKNLWHQLAPFASMLEGVEADREQFKALDYSNDQAWCLVLLGSSHALIWARNRQDNWDKVLRDWQDPRFINTISIPIKGQVVWWGSAWEEDNRAVRVNANADNLTIQNLHYGVFIRMKVS